MKKLTNEQKIKRLLYIKEIVYGYGIPPKSSSFWKDIKKLLKK